MSKMHKIAALFVAVLAATLSLAVGAGGAGADPYPPGSPTPPPSTTSSSTGNTGSLSDPNPKPGETFVVSAGGFLAGESVSFSLHSAVIYLGSSNADASGVAALPCTIPADFSGSHSIVMTGATSGRTVSISFSIDTSGSGGSGGSGGGSGGTDGSSSGGLSATGVAVTGIGVLGAALLVGGVLLLVAGRRKPLPVRSDS